MQKQFTGWPIKERASGKEIKSKIQGDAGELIVWKRSYKSQNAFIKMHNLNLIVLFLAIPKKPAVLWKKRGKVLQQPLSNVFFLLFWCWQYPPLTSFCLSILKELTELINSNRVVVVSGETGCGKTTQVTQFILDDHISRGLGSVCRVVCTQPRRISAISVCFLF